MLHTLPFASHLRIRTAAALFALISTCLLTAQAQTFTVLHAFNGPDGSFPTSGVAIAANDLLYGTTSYGGTYYDGVAYQLKRTAAGWIDTTLYPFDGLQAGQSPNGTLTFGPDGELYGTTTLGADAGGTVFSLKPHPTICKASACPWLESTTWSFRSPAGEEPVYGALVFDQQGNAYGTTAYGGENEEGVVYELSRQGQIWSITVLYRFGSVPNDGYRPMHNVVMDRAGNLYGTTYQGGSNGGGTVFQLVHSDGIWTENILANFPQELNRKPG